jgi:hypothetical protein
MNRWLSILALGALVAASACSSGSNNSGNTNSSGSTTAPPSGNAPAPASEGGIKFPVADFPAIATTAKAGEFVLAPEYDVIANASLKGLDAVFGEYRQHTMDSPGPEMSGVKFSNDGKVNQVPNPYLIAVPAGQSVHKGDIVLGVMSPWGLQRGIVTDAADPTQPEVAMLDLDYDDAAPNKVVLKLAPNTFVKVGGDLAPGASIYVTGSNTLDEIFTVVSASGDKVLARKSNGYFKVFTRSQCVAIPFTADFKPGDKGRGNWGGFLAPVTVTKVDARIGRIWVTSDNSSDKKPKALSLGAVLKV